ncbi:hypothetical protein ACNFJN_05070 [Xenorhabdus budapestensis]|uniref:hypothetical protein n=1 Tax=Xenorhabdus budapestensis TaxID=290110 RepID=UPI003A84070E
MPTTLIVFMIGSLPKNSVHRKERGHYLPLKKGASITSQHCTAACINRSSPLAKSQPRYRQVLLFQSKNAVSDSLYGEAGVSLSGLCCPLVAASLSAVNLPKVTP